MSRAQEVRSGYEEPLRGPQPFPIKTFSTSETAAEIIDRSRGWRWRMVETFERLAAAALLLLALPLIVLAGVVLFALSGTNPLIAHARVGLGGKSFWVLKLRTMWNRGTRGRKGARRFAIERISENGVPLKKSERDPRVTNRFAAFCRRFSIDEAPQFWHVVRGEMALIGPRPLTRSELVEHYGAAAPEVLRLRPGMTGLWQVKGRNRLTYRQRVRLDLFLVRKWSIGLYVNILLATIPKVLLGKDAW